MAEPEDEVPAVNADDAAASQAAPPGTPPSAAKAAGLNPRIMKLLMILLPFMVITTGGAFYFSNKMMQQRQQAMQQAAQKPAQADAVITMLADTASPGNSSGSKPHGAAEIKGESPASEGATNEPPREKSIVMWYKKPLRTGQVVIVKDKKVSLKAALSEIKDLSKRPDGYEYNFVRDDGYRLEILRIPGNDIYRVAVYTANDTMLLGQFSGGFAPKAAQDLLTGYADMRPVESLGIPRTSDEDRKAERTRLIEKMPDKTPQMIVRSPENSGTRTPSAGAPLKPPSFVVLRNGEEVLHDFTRAPVE